MLINAPEGKLHGAKCELFRDLGHGKLLVKLQEDRKPWKRGDLILVAESEVLHAS